MARTRRELLAQGAAAGAGAVLLGPAGAVGAVRDRTARPRTGPLARGGSFPQGVMAGQPNLRAATLWTQHAQPERPGPLVLEVATDPGFSRVLARQAVPVDPETGVAKQRLRSRRLRPGSQYFYRWMSESGSSPVGRFRTLRPADSAEPVRIGVFSCQMLGGVPP